MIVPSTFHPPPRRILRLPEVLTTVGLCRSQIFALIQQGQFPRQIKLGARASGWLEADVVRWLDEKIKLSETTR